MIRVTLNSNGAYWQAFWTDSAGGRHRQSLGAKATLTKRDALAKCSEMQRAFRESPGTASVPDKEICVDLLTLA